MNKILILLFLLFHSLLIAQKIQNAQLIEKNWIVLENEEKFLKLDTINLIEVENFSEHENSTSLSFIRNGELILNYYRIGYSSENKFKWKLNFESQIIEIEIVGQQKNKFKVLEIEKDKTTKIKLLKL